ncbi:MULTISPECIES: tetratricopeptide repeat protein [unclassified Alcanivorax]|uniref:tetratricopeptide repeat protein n=1 Tax=unclassified Alcanivorax TaxID=2638842 RepID=UPI000789CAEC|nr:MULTISPECIES: tetratricopeptide repeat protein [unclassified Alcanivorax]MEE2604516.1 tetratricopeptide repeat protein [Pseudomonadota bacterium]MEE3386598.1 tetratricopeptide repeat protein [Pseudomonadota bacterium]
MLKWSAMVLMLVSSLAWGRLDKPHQVQELAYGEVAYLYLQGDYFAALTRAQMALERGEVDVHRADLEVLLGAMYSAYGMPEDAERVFSALLDQQVSGEVAQRAWIHLAGLFYRQQKYQRALETLEQQVGTPPEGLQEVYLSLRARVLMRLGRYEKAAESLDAFAENHPLNAYLRYNLAISWINGKHPGLGQEWLWELANLPPGAPEVNAIKDKAMLALAIYMLRSDQEDRALQLLRDARLEGPFADVSLLLYARALLIENQPARALPVLQKLDRQSIQRSTVQEAQLAIPYLYEQMGDQRSARQAFQTALERFDGLEQYLLEVEARIASGAWFEEMVGEPRWSTAMDPVPPFLPKRVKSFPTFYEWFATTEFQHGWHNYHELMRQRNLLTQWQNTLPAMQTMLAAHERKHQQVRPQAKALLRELSRQDFQERLTRLQRDYDTAVSEQDPLPFATDKEQRLWEAQQEAERKTRGWGKRKRPDMTAKLDFYKGILLWEMQEDIVPRQWQRKQELSEISTLLDQTRVLRSRVMVASNRVQRLEYFRQELPALERELASLQQRGERLMRRQQYSLQASAFEQVTVTRKRLKRFSAAAHEGLADLYNKALRNRREPAAASGVEAPVE